MDGINTFTCLCPSGFTGSYCEHNINECDSKPCLNGGTCQDSYGTYKCTCPQGYTGLNCQVVRRFQGSLYAGMGLHPTEASLGLTSSLVFPAQNLVRWCDSSPCKNGGKCWQTNNLYRCECNSGWTGLYCDVPSVSCEVAAKQQGTSLPSYTLCTAWASPDFPRIAVTILGCTVSLGVPDVPTSHCSPWQVSTSLISAGTQGSVWTVATLTSAAARPATRAATARSKWTSAPQTPARTEPPARTTWGAIPVRWELLSCVGLFLGVAVTRVDRE